MQVSALEAQNGQADHDQHQLKVMAKFSEVGSSAEAASNGNGDRNEGLSLAEACLLGKNILGYDCQAFTK